MINVTKTFLPSFDEYSKILKRAWDNNWITNNGELLQELEQKLKTYLEIEHLYFTNNGTTPLLMSLKAFNITGEVITTPFSYVATTNSILWEGCTPVFVDIDANSLCIDPAKIEEAITHDTEAILATHVYGFPCDVERIQAIAKKHGLKVIYDGAHAFGCKYKGKSLLSYGDISTCSFHATKLFHTVEGGAIITNDPELAHRLMLFRQFGHIHDEYFSIGINGKNSEFHAAMGLALFPRLTEIIDGRKKVVTRYLEAFKNTNVKSPVEQMFNSPDIQWNYSYFPVLFKNEETLLFVKNKLAEHQIFTRRYFYPSLNKLSFLKHADTCSISEDISSRVLALPLYPDLSEMEQDQIIEQILNCLKTESF